MNMNIQYKLIEHEGFKSLTVITPDGDLEVVDNSNPRFDDIIAGVQAGDEEVFRLFNVEQGVSQAFNKVSERVSLKAGKVYLDNELIDGSLTDQIVRFYDEDQDFEPLVKFLENIANNPSNHSRTQLYDWLRNRDFTIDSDGHILAYKGVRSVSKDGETKYESISHGKAIVDGVEYDGAIPNYVGAVVEMPRSQVEFNPSVACNVGLHAGNWRYAHSFAQGATLTVSINPRDVVSVPVDSNAEKIRVCRYTVLEVVDQPYSGAYYNSNVTDDAIDYEEADDDDLDDEEKDDDYQEWEDSYAPEEDDEDDDEEDDPDLEQTIDLDESPDTVADEPEQPEEPVEDPVEPDEFDSGDDTEVQNEENSGDALDQSKSDGEVEESISQETQPVISDVNDQNRNLSQVTNWGTSSASITNFGKWGTN